VAVIGAGGIGLNCIQGARIAGAGSIIAVDVNPSKLALALELGATHAVDASAVDPVEAVHELTAGGVHHAFEAVGAKLAAEQAFAMLRRGGTATIVGMLPQGVKIELTGTDFIDEKRIQGSNMGSNRFRTDMPRYLGFYADGRLDLDRLISRRVTLDDLGEAFAALERGETTRSVVIFD
jgi:S-(hydroxymethyl)glutathione dehydrogenase/alcohol dehydrogenase